MLFFYINVSAFHKNIEVSALKCHLLRFKSDVFLGSLLFINIVLSCVALYKKSIVCVYQSNQRCFLIKNILKVRGCYVFDIGLVKIDVKQVNMCSNRLPFGYLSLKLVISTLVMSFGH